MSQLDPIVFGSIFLPRSPNSLLSLLRCVFLGDRRQPPGGGELPRTRARRLFQRRSFLLLVCERRAYARASLKEVRSRGGGAQHLSSRLSPKGAC